MKSFLDILTEAALAEQFFGEVSGTKVYCNPTRREVQWLIDKSWVMARDRSPDDAADHDNRFEPDVSLRGLIDQDGKVYVWDGFYATHEMVAMTLHLSLDYAAFYIERDHAVRPWNDHVDEVRDNRIVQSWRLPFIAGGRRV